MAGVNLSKTRQAFGIPEGQHPLTAIALGYAADPAQAVRVYPEAVRRYQAVVEKYPEFQHVNQARFGLAGAHYAAGKYPEAAAVYSVIPAAERVNTLAPVP